MDDNFHISNKTQIIKTPGGSYMGNFAPSPIEGLRNELIETKNELSELKKEFKEFRENLYQHLFSEELQKETEVENEK